MAAAFSHSLICLGFGVGKAEQGNGWGAGRYQWVPVRKQGKSGRSRAHFWDKMEKD